MQRHVRIRRIRVQTLPHHHHRLPVRILPLPQKRNLRRHLHIPTRLLPRKLKRIRPTPHILPATRHQITLLRRVILHSSLILRPTVPASPCPSKIPTAPKSCTRSPAAHPIPTTKIPKQKIAPTPAPIFRITVPSIFEPPTIGPPQLEVNVAHPLLPGLRGFARGTIYRAPAEAQSSYGYSTAAPQVRKIIASYLLPHTPRVGPGVLVSKARRSLRVEWPNFRIGLHQIIALQKTNHHPERTPRSEESLFDLPSRTNPTGTIAPRSIPCSSLSPQHPRAPEQLFIRPAPRALQSRLHAPICLWHISVLDFRCSRHRSLHATSFRKRTPRRCR